MTIRMVLLLFTLSIYGCLHTNEPPDGVYLKVYAMQFVEEMRTSGLQAGAFEISRRPDGEGLYRLSVDLMKNENIQQLKISLRSNKQGGLRPIDAKLESAAVYPRPTKEWIKFEVWHKAAATRAASE